MAARPAWLMPTWIALTQHGNKRPEFLDATHVRWVEGDKPAILHLAGGGSLVVAESAEEVLKDIANRLSSPVR